MRIVAVLVLVPLAAAVASVPATLVSDDEAEPLRSAIIRKEAWTQDAARRLRADADRRLMQGPWSVTSERPANPLLDSHDYYSEAPYYWPDPENPAGPYVLKDGHINPDRFTANRTALTQMCDSVFALGTAAYLFDDSRYAQHAARILQVWFAAPKTRMNPSLEYARAIRGVNTGTPAGILEGRYFIRAIQGIEFLERSGYWDAKEQAAVRKWFEEYLHWLMQSKNGQEEKAGGTNQAAWWTAQVAAVGTFVQDEAAAKMAFAYYRDRLFPRQILADGSTRDESRTSAITAVMNLEAFTMIGRIAEVQGVDLWNVRATSGATISTIIQHLQPELTDPSKWSREQVVDLETEELYFLAFAGIGLKKPEYIALYQRLEHPDRAWLSLVDLLVGRWSAAGHQTRH